MIKKMTGITKGEKEIIKRLKNQEMQENLEKIRFVIVLFDEREREKGKGDDNNNIRFRFQIALRATLLEHENAVLRAQILTLREETQNLREKIIYNKCVVSDDNDDSFFINDTNTRTCTYTHTRTFFRQNVFIQKNFF